MKVRYLIYLFTALALAGCAAEYGDNIGDHEGNKSSPYTVDAVVTVKQDADGTVFFQFTDNQRLFPGNDYPFTRQMRAWGSLTIYAEEIPLYGNKVDVNWLEPLDEGQFTSSSPSVQTPLGVDIMLDSWVTSVEDGYVTLRYKTWWGEPAGHHDFYLAALDSTDPYSLTLYQDSHSDGKDSYTEAIICFDINSLPDTGDTYKTLTLNWITTQGKTETAQFGFKTRK